MTQKIRVKGGNPLHGTVAISGSKNATLPLLVATLLTKEPVVLHNVPNLGDIQMMKALLLSLGVKITEADNGRTLTLQSDEIKNYTAAYDMVSKMRASYYVLGPLTARFKNADVALPGGCAIGARPTNFHTDALREMGADIRLENGYIKASVKERLRGAKIQFAKQSVGATINTMMAAVLADGETVINNAATEPHVVDVAILLNKMGGKVSGAGTTKITVKGVSLLHGAEHSVIADQIEAGTYAVAAAITHGRLEIRGIKSDVLAAELDVLRKIGAKIADTADGFTVDAVGVALKATDVMIKPYPGVPTDMQAQLMALLTVAEGTSLVTETIWENRFMHVPELVRLGANIKVLSTSEALVTGVKKLYGAEVKATDLRASVCLILAGLAAEGETLVSEIHHLDRGYENIESKLSACGAEIQRIEVING